MRWQRLITSLQVDKRTPDLSGVLLLEYKTIIKNIKEALI